MTQTYHYHTKAVCLPLVACMITTLCRSPCTYSLSSKSLSVFLICCARGTELLWVRNEHKWHAWYALSNADYMHTHTYTCSPGQHAMCNFFNSTSTTRNLYCMHNIIHDYMQQRKLELLIELLCAVDWVQKKPERTLFCKVILKYPNIQCF